MKPVNSLKKLIIATGAALVLSAGSSAVFADNLNPFGMSDFHQSTQLANNDAKCGAAKEKMQESKCGTGKCGDGKAKIKEGKCGDGKADMHEDKCGDGKTKMKEGKCGDGKAKMKQSKCGAME